VCVVVCECVCVCVVVCCFVVSVMLNCGILLVLCLNIFVLTSKSKLHNIYNLYKVI